MAEDYLRLRAIPLFASLKNDELAFIGSIVKQTTYPANETIITQGDQGETFYIVASGQVRVVRQDESGAKVVIRLLGQGGHFGESSLLYGEPRNATVEATVPTTLLYIEQDDFNVMMEKLPGVGKQLKRTAGRRSKSLGLDRFDWQLPDESILWLARRNVIPLFFESLGSLLVWHVIAAVLAVVSFMIPRFGPVLAGWQWPLRVLAFLTVSLVWVWYIVDWTNDYLVLTNRRIVHAERYGILRETRKEIPIRAIQNVELSSGWPTSVLGLADITIKTIGGVLTFTHIDEAEHLQSRILDQRALDQQAVHREDREDIRQSLIKALRPESLAVPAQSSPKPPDAFAALLKARPQKPARTPMGEQWRSLRQMRVEKGEEITWRKHWLVLLNRLSGPILAALAGIALSAALIVSPSVLNRLSLPRAAALIPLLAVQAALGWGLWEFLVWGGDIYTLTANRIVDIERLPLGLREKRRESNLDRIQDIDVSVPNILARLFEMGDVYIKTGAAGSDLTFQSVANPYDVQRDIFHKLASLRRTEEKARRQQTMEEITRWLVVYNELTTRPVESQVEKQEPE